MPAFFERLVDAASRPYLDAGRVAFYFARGKLSQDPVFLALLQRGVLPVHGQLTDLGCGQGSLIAILLAARDAYQRGEWPAGWPEPPDCATVHGVDLRPAAVRRARIAFGGRANVEPGDVRSTPIPRSAAIAILDVLHYIKPDEQIAVLRRCHQALEPGGRFVMRVGDGAAGLRFLVTILGDRVVTMLRGSLLPHFYCRSAFEWQELVASIGFDVTAHPMSAGTPFANVLLIGDRK